jgi:hypothetical protein
MKLSAWNIFISESFEKRIAAKLGDPQFDKARSKAVSRGIRLAPDADPSVLADHAASVRRDETASNRQNTMPMPQALSTAPIGLQKVWFTAAFPANSSPTGLLPSDDERSLGVIVHRFRVRILPSASWHPCCYLTFSLTQA